MLLFLKLLMAGLVLYAALAIGSHNAHGAIQPPTPDPAPQACHYGWCPVVTYVAYDINVPAVDAKTGKRIPGHYFTCHVPVRWHGKPNVWGHKTCVPRVGKIP